MTDTSETANTPLILPDDYNPETYMRAKQTEYGLFHESRAAARLAEDLVANGTPQDLALAEKVLEATLTCQERDPHDPHYGNFYWMREDDVVFDLNAVEFNLESLIPMMIRYRDRLTPATQARVLDSIRLGLDEIRKLDVLVAYSNITVLDIVNSCLGGELLQDEAIARRGYQKLAGWMAFTDLYGIPFEYNSATYTSVTIRALKRLLDMVQDQATQIRARTALARLGLSVALHIHQTTGRWAGPHSRAYHPSVICETPPEVEMVRAWINEGALPRWVEDALSQRPARMTVVETAQPEFEYGISTYHSPAFALGVSAKEFGGQSNVCIAHYDRPGADRAGVMFTRYTLNDKWLGDSYHATDRTKSRNLVDEGSFYGVQNGPKAIGLYTIPNNLGLCSSAKASIVWTQRDLVDEIWIGDRRVDHLPAAVQPGEIIVIGSGEALFAIRPLTLGAMGRATPVELVERAGDLVLDLYNYRGSEKTFWEMRWPGAFYQGKPQCGFYLEMAERSDYVDGAAFGAVVAGGTLVDEAEAPFVYAREGERLWTVSYSRDGQTLGLEVDLMLWALKRRWIEAGDLGWPMLESPVARENRQGRVEVGPAVLLCGQEAGWLWANPEGQRWVAAYHGTQPAPLHLTVPGGEVKLAGIVMGTLVWDHGQVTVDALGLEGEPEIQGGELA